MLSNIVGPADASRNQRLADAQAENASLKAIAIHLHWMARRYVDGRQSYATSLHNENTRELLAMGVPLNATGDGTLWARDAGGRAYDGLTDEEAAQGRAPDWKHDDKERRIEQQSALLKQMAEALEVSRSIVQISVVFPSANSAADLDQELVLAAKKSVERTESALAAYSAMVGK